MHTQGIALEGLITKGVVAGNVLHFLHQENRALHRCRIQT